MTSPDTLCSPQDVLSFWFSEIEREHWFKPSAEVDAACRARFADTHLALSRHVPDLWRDTGESRLAAIILLDQIPRNIYRASPLAFATDGLALREAHLMLLAGADLGLTTDQRAFAYLPFEHSEALEHQEKSVQLFRELGNAHYLDFAVRHQRIIETFGRFPHRNALLGRPSTPQELAFLEQPGSSF